MTDTAAEKIDAMIAGLEDWRGPLLTRVRQGFLAADDAMIEEWKWMGSPTWSCDGLVAVANPHKQKIKITFAHGAALPDPAGLFNGNDTGATRRSIDLFAPEDLDDAALITLIRAAIAYNRTHLKKNAGKKAR